MPLALDTVTIGAATFPLARGQGFARVDEAPAIKIDKQKPGGKGKAKSKVAGVEPLDFRITVAVVVRDEAAKAAGAAFFDEVNPNGPNGGKPKTMAWTDPLVGPRSCSILVEKVSPRKLGPGGSRVDFTIDASEWTEPEAAAGATGTTTPAQADPAEFGEIDGPGGFGSQIDGGGDPGPDVLP